MSCALQLADVPFANATVDGNAENGTAAVVANCAIGVARTMDATVGHTTVPHRAGIAMAKSSCLRAVGDTLPQLLEEACILADDGRPIHDGRHRNVVV